MPLKLGPNTHQMLQVREPRTTKEMDLLYKLRYEVLRKPWGEPKGSEVDPGDPTAEHVIALNEQDQIVGTGRLHLNNSEEAQIRYMAVDTQQQKAGVGKALVQYLEEKAIERGAEVIMLHARETALPFYEKLGYHVVDKSYLLFGEIQHYRMEKQLPRREAELD